MQIIADLQLHSRFSRAVSREMTIPNIATWATRKGIGVVATGDWTHPLWFREIEKDLEELGNGLLRLKPGAVGGSPRQGPTAPSPLGPGAKAVTGLKKALLPASLSDSPLFLLATEVSCIYSQGGKGRRVHILVWVPTLSSAAKINQAMTKQGCNLMSDGRPIIGLSSIQISELVLSIEPKALIIPAHAWTPWFSVYGGMSGFDSLEEAFGPFSKNIYAVETGLSSSPAMNWRIKELDNRAIVSFSDAHSGPKLGREATVFEISEGELSYEAIYKAITNTAADSGATFFGDARQPRPAASKTSSFSLSEIPPPTDKKSIRTKGGRGFSAPQNERPPSGGPSIAFTIEFYPEEGKYHYTGHRQCQVRLNPEEAKLKGASCSVCGKPLTQGVMQRVEDLASRSEADLKLKTMNYELNTEKTSPRMIYSESFPFRPPFVMLVPLQEVIAEAIGSPVIGPKVQNYYQRLTDEIGGEFSILLKANSLDIARVAGARVAEGIAKVRRGEIVIDPGYDGVFGRVKIWEESEGKSAHNDSQEQLSIF